jgi:predicted alpha/beta superfamily hydrolase
VSGPHLIKHEQFASRLLKNRRDLIVNLPPGYDDQPKRRFPVLYLHDGQNLFDGATSFIPGMDWHVGQTAAACIGQGQVVHRGYTEKDVRAIPFKSRRKNGGGGGSRTPVRKALRLEAYMLSSIR